jgi:hypothetical protein
VLQSGDSGARSVRYEAYKRMGGNVMLIIKKIKKKWRQEEKEVETKSGSLVKNKQ